MEAQNNKLGCCNGFKTEGGNKVHARDCLGELCLKSLREATEKLKGDPVNHPAHYTFGKVEVIDVLEDWFGAKPLLWQVGKYLARAGKKNNELEDLKKARWYLDRQITKMEATLAKDKT